MSEPTFTNADDAAQALAAAIEADAQGAATPPAPVAPPSPANQPEDVARQPAEEPPAEPDSFTDINAALDALPEEAQHLVRERFNQMQGDYTRKTQLAAESRREAEQAIEFVQNLQSDPQFALQVRDEIQSALEEAGLTPAEARAEANAQVSDAQDASVADGNELDDPVEARVRELEEKLNSFEMDQQTREYEMEFDRQDVAVRQTYPDWEEEDMRHVYALSYATGGNLIQAAELYKQEQDRMISAYLARKTAINSGAPSTPGATGPAQTPPEGFDGLFDPRLNSAAERMLAESLGD